MADSVGEDSLATTVAGQSDSNTQLIKPMVAKAVRHSQPRWRGDTAIRSRRSMNPPKPYKPVEMKFVGAKRANR